MSTGVLIKCITTNCDISDIVSSQSNPYLQQSIYTPDDTHTMKDLKNIIYIVWTMCVSSCVSTYVTTKENILAITSTL